MELLSAEAEVWLRERLEATFLARGKVSQGAIADLDWPELPASSRTDDVKELIHEVLTAMIERSPDDFDEHITRKVCERIEAYPRWLSRYQILCDEHSRSIRSGDGKSVVNKSIGRWTKRALGAGSWRQVAAPPGTTSLIQSYTLLRFSPPGRPTDLVT